MTKRLVLPVVAALTSITVLFVAGEVGIRGYRALSHSSSSVAHSPLVLDPKLGWRTTEYYACDEKERNGAGQACVIHYESDRAGFRIFGNIQSRLTKILVLGDSFTQGRQVFTKDTYYARLRDELPAEVFAYGGSGYGSLQEYMILDENFDLIKPDIVLWQYCGNDFINNSFDLEYHSSVNNNGMLRPYLTGDGTISYLIPRSHPYVRTLANNYSQFLYLIISRLDRLQAMQAGERRADTAETVENEITAQGAKHPGFRHSAMITKEIMGRVRLRCGAARLIAFCSDDEEPYYSEFRRISHESGFEFIDGVPQGIRAAEQRGGLVRAADNAHWNELGHRMVADAVIRYLKKHEQN